MTEQDYNSPSPNFSIVPDRAGLCRAVWTLADGSTVDFGGVPDDAPVVACPEGADKGAQGAGGLSSSHICPVKYPGLDGKGWEGRENLDTDCWAEFADGGSLARVRVRKSGPFAGGGLRGRISSFSPGSRRRLLQMFASLKSDLMPVFVTLTYPSVFPDAATSKRDLHNFLKRWLRKYPRSSWIWKLEKQKRGAPHFHIFVWGVPYTALLLHVSPTWYQVVGSGDVKHLRAGTRVELLRSIRGAFFYASKYLAKVDGGSDNFDGRWWGVEGREFLPWAEFKRLYLSRGQAQTVLRYFRRFAKLRSRDYRSLSIFCCAGFWLRKLDELFSG